MIPLTFDRPGLAYVAAAFVLTFVFGGLALMSSPLLDSAYEDRTKLERLARVSAQADILRSRIASGAVPAAEPEPDTQTATTDLRDWLGDTANQTGILIDAVREDWNDGSTLPVLVLEADASELVLARFLNELGQDTSPAIVLGYTLQKNGYRYDDDDDGYEEEKLTFTLRVTPLSGFQGEEES